MIGKDRVHQGYLIKAIGPEKGNWQETVEQRRRAVDDQLEPLSGVVVNNPDNNNQESSEQRVRAAHHQMTPISGIELNDPKKTGVVISDAEHRARSDNLKFGYEIEAPEVSPSAGLAGLSPIEFPQPEIAGDALSEEKLKEAA